MASRDHDEMLRELRHTTGLVLVRRRGTNNRRGRGSLWRDWRGSPGALWRDKGSPKAERSTAKGKRTRKQNAASEDTDRFTNHQLCDQLTHLPGCSYPAQTCYCYLHLLPVPTPPSSRCSSTSSLASIGLQETQLASVAQPCRSNFDCSAVDCSLPTATELTSRPCQKPEGYGSVQLTSNVSQSARGYTACSCCSSSGKDYRHEGTYVWTEVNEIPSKRSWRHFRRFVDPEVNSDAQKTVWINENVSGHHPSVSLCSCWESDGERGEREECDNVCHLQHQVDSTRRFSQEKTLASSQALTVLPKRDDPDSVLNQADIGSSELLTADRDLALKTSYSSPWHSHQQNLSPVPSQDQDPAGQESNIYPCQGQYKHVRSTQTPNFDALYQARQVCPHEKNNCPTVSNSCTDRLRSWSRMLRMRHVGRCLVLLLLGCCGLLAHVTISDYNMPDQNGSGDVTGDFGGSFGVGIGHGGVIPVSKIMKMHMQPVPLREFHARLRTIRNKFDFLRIFLADQDMTDDSLRSLFSASVLSPSTDNLMHTDFSQPAQLSVGTPAPLTSSTAQHDLTSADDTLIPTEKNDPVSSRNVAKEEGGLVRLLTSKSMLTSAIGSKEDSNRDAGVSKLASSRSHPALSQTEHLSHEDTILHKLKIPVANIDILDRDLDNAEVKKEGDIALSGKGSYSKVEKRAEEWYEDYSVEDLDGNVDYFNDEQHPDAFMEELEEAVYHITEMENNPQARCHDPQPTVVYIEDPKKLKRQFYPECTVVHRCRQDGGCCGRNSECGPKTEQVIMRSFLVVNVDPTSDTVMPDSEMVERIALVNHTECECREKKPVPKCNQSCPGVFRMRRYGAQCVCDCDSVPNERFPQCDGVKDGLYPLSQADLVCIKSGSCGLPKCSVGTFDVQSGLCPLNDAPTFAGHLQQQLYERHQQRQRRRPTVVEGSGDF